ncbi:MAG: hypothetical protein H7338_21520 [Candidatus Sericytochromatia bacterium]|nr:hypothetical protein [Candidatus Sericytochromatia bacterium]
MDKKPKRRHEYTDSFSRSEDPMTALGLPARSGQTGRLQPLPPTPAGRPLSAEVPAPRPPVARSPIKIRIAALGTGPLAQKFDSVLDKGADSLATVLFGAVQVVIMPLIKVLSWPLVLIQYLITLPLQMVTGVIDFVTGLMGGFATPPGRPAVSTRRAATPTAPPPPETSLELGFVSLYQQGIRFLTVRNVALVNPEHLQLSDADAIIMARALLEIQASAQFADDLPSPVKGPYADRPISEIMALIDRRELFAFLAYVESHPQPFLERQLKLSEAFATWVHKGAPN